MSSSKMGWQMYYIGTYITNKKDSGIMRYKVLCVFFGIIIAFSISGCNMQSDNAQANNETVASPSNTLQDSPTNTAVDNDATYVDEARELLTLKKLDEFDAIISKINDTTKRTNLLAEKTSLLNKIQESFWYNSIGVILEEDYETKYESYHIAAVTKEGKVLISNLNDTKIQGDTVGRESYKKADGTNGIKVTQVRALSYVQDWEDITSIACNNSYILGLTKDGKGLTAGESLDAANAIDPFMGSASVWYNEVRNNNKKISSIIAGVSHSLAVTTDYNVLTCGFEANFAGTRKNEVPGAIAAFKWHDVISVAAGLEHSIGLKKDGTVVAVGSNYCGQCEVEDWTNIVGVAAGNGFSAGLKADGTVVTAGYMQEKGDINVSSWKDVYRLYAGLKEIIGIKNDGTLLIFGDFDGKSDAEKWTDIKEVALQYGSDMVGLKNDGTLITLLKNQTEISSWSNIGY